MGPTCDELRLPWLQAIADVYANARLDVPVDGKYRSTGRIGTHSEHMGFILTDMQHLQRTFPGGVW